MPKKVFNIYQDNRYTVQKMTLRITTATTEVRCDNHCGRMIKLKSRIMKASFRSTSPRSYCKTCTTNILVSAIRALRVGNYLSTKDKKDISSALAMNSLSSS